MSEKIKDRTRNFKKRDKRIIRDEKWDKIRTQVRQQNTQYKNMYETATSEIALIR